jgi:hypothetical protein
MASRITLKEIETLLKKGTIDGELLKDVDAVMGAITFFAPMAVGLAPGTIDAITSVLGTRESLINAGAPVHYESPRGHDSRNLDAGDVDADQ